MDVRPYWDEDGNYVNDDPKLARNPYWDEDGVFVTDDPNTVTRTHAPPDTTGVRPRYAAKLPLKVIED